jgi:PAS domain S-box-containing protein
MNVNDHNAAGGEIADFLAQSCFAGQWRGGAPLLVASDEPARIVFANDSMRAAFGAATIDQLNAIAMAGGSPGARRLSRLAAAAAIGAPPRLELLRFYAGRLPVQRALLCARISDANGKAFFVAAAPESGAETAERIARATGESPTSSPDSAPQQADSNAPAKARRFLWSADENLNFASPARALVEAVGGAAPRAGESLEAIKARTRLDEDGALALALAKQATFGSLRVAWPRGVSQATGDDAAIVALSGAPIFDRHRRFLGYRGFGVFTGETASFEPTPKAEAEREEPLSTSQPTPPVAAELVSSPTASQSAQEEPVAQMPTERSADVVPLRAFVQAYPGGPNVVPIRPGAIRQFPVIDEEPRRDEDVEGVELSTHERDAFREIARALGAKVKDRRDEKSDRDAAASSAQEKTRDLMDVSASDAPSTPDVALAHGTDASAGDANALLDRLPIGALVTRGGEALYLNQTLLDLLGYRDLAQFRASSGLTRTFKGRRPEQIGMAGETSALSLQSAEGESITVDGQIQEIEWDGASASLVSLRRSMEAEFAPKLKVLEFDAQARGREARELATVLDTATDGVVMIDAQGAIVSLNRPAEALFGFDQKEVIGESFVTLLSPESREPIKDYFDGLRTSGLASLLNDGREALGRERHGRSLPLFITMGRVNSSPDAKFCAVLRDMTQWKTIERDLEAARGQAEKANALKSEFLAKISHEIRTPLNAIIGFAEVIIDERFGPLGNERYKEYLKDIHASGTHVMSLVNDLLDLSKIEAGKLDFNFAPIDANSVIQECVSLMQPQAAQERIIMRLSLFDKLPRIIADERSLRQIMLNLMSNAVKFNEPGGQVIVSTALNDSGQAVIRVRDTGIGMSDAELGTAMEPFRQISSPRQKGGTGLGLPLTKALVEANRAGISIKSRKEQGTLVEVAFPTAQAAAAQ